MDEIIRQSYLWQQEFSLGDLGVSFHCNVTSNLSVSIASLSAKEGKYNCEEKKLKENVSLHNDIDGKYGSGFDGLGV